MSTEHAHYPPMPSTDPWTPRVEQPLKSALKAKWGQEPEFTCYSYADRVLYRWEERVEEAGVIGEGVIDGVMGATHFFITPTPKHTPQ